MIALQSNRGPIVAKEAPRESRSPAIAAPATFLQKRRLRRKQAQAGLLAAGAVTAALVCWAFADLFVTKTKIVRAEERTAIFEKLAEEAELGSVATAVASLDQVVGDSSSGTSQAAESPLDRIVERSRRSAVERIVAALRKKTGQDFGDDPKAWLRELR